MGKLHGEKQVALPWHFFPLIVHSQLHYSILAQRHCKVCVPEPMETDLPPLQTGQTRGCLLWFGSCFKWSIRPNYWKTKTHNLMQKSSRCTSSTYLKMFSSSQQHLISEWPLKGNSTNFTHSSVLGRTTACMKKSITKPFVTPEEAACNLINCLQWCCSVAKLHCG